MRRNLFVILMALVPAITLDAQEADSVIINVGESSKVIFAIGDKKDIETLKQYDFQAVINDLATKLENRDSTAHEKPAEEYVKPAEETSELRKIETDNGNDDNEDWDDSWERR